VEMARELRELKERWRQRSVRSENTNPENPVLIHSSVRAANPNPKKDSRRNMHHRHFP